MTIAVPSTAQARPRCSDRAKITPATRPSAPGTGVPESPTSTSVRGSSTGPPPRAAVDTGARAAHDIAGRPAVPSDRTIDRRGQHRGYHTVCAPPGYELYYLNVMVGPRRAWAVANDPDHEWTL